MYNPAKLGRSVLASLQVDQAEKAANARSLRLLDERVTGHLPDRQRLQKTVGYPMPRQAPSHLPKVFLFETRHLQTSPLRHKSEWCGPQVR